MEASRDNWNRSAVREFWGSIAPSDHVVQIYDDDHTFLDLLEDFVIAGFASNDCVIVIATEEHLHALEDRLKFKGENPFELKLQDQYIPMNAREALGEFMINNWPDEVLFTHFVNRLVTRAHARNRHVRIFGEMVALLWAQGNIAATVKLEHLWNKICQNERVSLFCGYPRTFLNQNALEAILSICGIHSKMIIIPDDSSQQIMFKEIPFSERTEQHSD